MIKLLAYIIGLILIATLSIYSVGVYLSPADELERSDVIVAVSGGDTEARTLRAVEVYKEGYSDKIIFSGDALDPISKSNAQAMKEIAVKHEVPISNITIEEDSKNTAENAINTARILNENDYKNIILVTSPYHQRRTFLEFKKNITRDMTIINSPAKDDAWSRSGWFNNPRGIGLTLSELPKTVFLQMRELF